ncbi:MAG: HAD family phosphatase [bacterium]|nr:HAD family phosphatase [bacterium]
MDIDKIEAVIFDVGGVLHENRTAATDYLLDKLVVSGETLSNIWAEYMPRLGSGQIDEREFWQLVSSSHGVRKVDISENLLGRSLADSLNPYAEVGALVGKLSELGIKTAILSNTIEPHAKALRAAGLYDSFDLIVLSHEVGMRKPSIDIYEHTLAELMVAPEKTIFIDDLTENVQAAASIGLHGIVYVDPMQLTRDLGQLIPQL